MLTSLLIYAASLSVGNVAAQTCVTDTFSAEAFAMSGVPLANPFDFFFPRLKTMVEKYKYCAGNEMDPAVASKPNLHILMTLMNTMYLYMESYDNDESAYYDMSSCTRVNGFYSCIAKLLSTGYNFINLPAGGAPWPILFSQQKDSCSRTYKFSCTEAFKFDETVFGRFYSTASIVAAGAQGDCDLEVAASCAVKMSFTYANYLTLSDFRGASVQPDIYQEEFALCEAVKNYTSCVNSATIRCADPVFMGILNNETKLVTEAITCSTYNCTSDEPDSPGWECISEIVNAFRTVVFLPDTAVVEDVCDVSFVECVAENFLACKGVNSLAGRGLFRFFFSPLNKFCAANDPTWANEDDAGGDGVPIPPGFDLSAISVMFESESAECLFQAGVCSGHFEAVIHSALTQNSNMCKIKLPMFTGCFTTLAMSGKCSASASEYMLTMVEHFAILVEELSFPNCKLVSAYTCAYSWQTIVSPEGLKGLDEADLVCGDEDFAADAYPCTCQSPRDDPDAECFREAEDEFCADPGIKQKYASCITASVANCAAATKTKLTAIASEMEKASSTACNSTCFPNPCENGGICYTLLDGKASCSCKPEFRGAMCNETACDIDEMKVCIAEQSIDYFDGLITSAATSKLATCEFINGVIDCVSNNTYSCTGAERDTVSITLDYILSRKFLNCSAVGAVADPLEGCTRTLAALVSIKTALSSLLSVGSSGFCNAWTLIQATIKAVPEDCSFLKGRFAAIGTAICPSATCDIYNATVAAENLTDTVESVVYSTPGDNGNCSVIIKTVSEIEGLILDCPGVWKVKILENLKDSITTASYSCSDTCDTTKCTSKGLAAFATAIPAGTSAICKAATDFKTCLLDGNFWCDTATGLKVTYFMRAVLAPFLKLCSAAPPSIGTCTLPSCFLTSLATPEAFKACFIDGPGVGSSCALRYVLLGFYDYHWGGAKCNVQEATTCLSWLVNSKYSDKMEDWNVWLDNQNALVPSEEPEVVVEDGEDVVEEEDNNDSNVESDGTFKWKKHSFGVVVPRTSKARSCQAVTELKKCITTSISTCAAADYWIIFVNKTLVEYRLDTMIGDCEVCNKSQIYSMILAAFVNETAYSFSNIEPLLSGCPDDFKWSIEAVFKTYKYITTIRSGCNLSDLNATCKNTVECWTEDETARKAFMKAVEDKDAAALSLGCSYFKKIDTSISSCAKKDEDCTLWERFASVLSVICSSDFPPKDGDGGDGGNGGGKTCDADAGAECASDSVNHAVDVVVWKLKSMLEGCEEERKTECAKLSEGDSGGKKGQKKKKVKGKGKAKGKGKGSGTGEVDGNCLFLKLLN